MSSNKINTLIEKYKLTNIIKVILLLLILFLVFRIFIESESKQNIYEGFAQAVLGNGNIYGNVISLNEPTNMPIFSKNTCIFILSEPLRIDTLKFNFTVAKTFTISFEDGNGISRNIKSSGTTVSSGSPPTFTGMNLTINNITDENGTPVYTSKLILTITNTTVDLTDAILTSFGIYGGDKNLPTLSTYNTISNTLALNDKLFVLSTGTTTPTNNLLDTYTFNQPNDTMIYSLRLNLELIGQEIMSPTITENPFNIVITYENSMYYKNIFTINTKYIVRNDYKALSDDKLSTYIFLTQPIIANKLTFTISRISNKNLSVKYGLNVTKVTVLDKVPSTIEISDYKRTIELIQSSQSEPNGNSNICPSINELVDTQTKTQQICDNMEYQDKVKSEKLRLERNKQYLLKLKDQQDQIDQLNNAIQDLENKRQSRANISDQVRVLQYQKQKGDSSTIRDLANQRLESQANNQLYMDVSFSNS
jgi:hypothetical protein